MSLKEKVGYKSNKTSFSSKLRLQLQLAVQSGTWNEKNTKKGRLTMRFLWLSTIVSLLSSSVDALASTTTSQARRQESLSVGNNPLLSLNLNLDALAKASAPERAQELYQRISALYNEGYYSVAPDTCSFNSVLKAWENYPAEACNFWELQKGNIDPNIRSYNTLMLALAKAGMADTTEDILRQLYELGTVMPDTVSYNTVLFAYASSDDVEAVEKSEKLLHEMVASTYLKPDSITLNTMLTTCLANQELQMAENWFAKMTEYDVEPDVYSYTSLVHAWGTFGKY